MACPAPWLRRMVPPDRFTHASKAGRISRRRESTTTGSSADTHSEMVRTAQWSWCHRVYTERGEGWAACHHCNTQRFGVSVLDPHLAREQLCWSYTLNRTL